MRDRICVKKHWCSDCGKLFVGGYHAQRCPDCRLIHIQEATRKAYLKIKQKREAERAGRPKKRRPPKPNYGNKHKVVAEITERHCKYCGDLIVYYNDKAGNPVGEWLRNICDKPDCKRMWSTESNGCAPGFEYMLDIGDDDEGNRDNDQA